MSRLTESIKVRLTPTQAKQLAELAERRDTTESEIVRQLIRQSHERSMRKAAANG